ncbi:MAG: hypothetical protein KatS3mg085_107 [Candidatus Dojkabacteria bacterium]|nr:MAG: hypothetical protein KatS3mg085_107 [Candidatus Dojkabacteria bacterium]
MLVYLILNMNNDLTQLTKNIKVAQIIEINKHPNADRLVLVKLDIGANQVVEIVTGATNINVSDFVPFLSSGSIVPGYKIFENKTILLQPKDIRGVVSNGMILSEFEVGFSDDHSGIFILNEFGINEDDIGKSLIEVIPEILEKVSNNFNY